MRTLKPALICYFNNNKMSYIDEVSRLEVARYIKMLRHKGFKVKRTTKPHWSLLCSEYECKNNDGIIANINFAS